MEAEKEALGACEELRPYLRRELGWPLTELARIRQRRGDLDGAETAFLAAHECGWDPQPGLALVYLARGDVAGAATAIRGALDPSSVPSKELPPDTDLRRAPLLDAAVEIELAAGELERARRAAEELSRIAATFESKALAASATLARARVQLAVGQAADARTSFEHAMRLWNEIEAPYETARARLGLAEAQRAAGNEQLADLEIRAAHATLARLSAEPHTERPPAPRAERQLAASDQAFLCEGDAWLLAFAGRSVRLRDLKGLHYLARLLAEHCRSHVDGGPRSNRAGSSRARVPGSRALARRGSWRPRSPRGFSSRARPSERHARGAAGHGSHSRAPWAVGRSPRAGRAHRDALRLSPRPARAGPVDVLAARFWRSPRPPPRGLFHTDERNIPLVESLAAGIYLTVFTWGQAQSLLHA